MCTLTLALRVFPEAPVVLVANRDESLTRPSKPPTVRPGSPTVVAPRDALAGGTWIGVTETGLVAAITNRWLDVEVDADRSRGLLVEACLAESTARAAVERLRRELARHRYDGFNLVLADATAAYLVAYDGRPSTIRLDPGTHVVGNVGGVVNGTERFTVPERRAAAGVERVESARRVAAALVPAVDRSAAASAEERGDEPAEGREAESADEWGDRAADVLADHDYGACLHGDGFGTRSCSRIRTGTAPRFAFADGPPCETPLEPIALPEGFGVTVAPDDAESQF